MAYLVELDRRCSNRCGRRATVEVRNRLNATVGYFCRACGKTKLRELTRREEAHPLPAGVTAPEVP